jgi:uncharacterized protein (DUF433 family)
MTRKRLPARSSAAEYLTFVAASGTGGVEAVYADENVWLSQKMMAQLYDVEVPTINYHLRKVSEDSELEVDSVIRNFRITAGDGKTVDTRHYELSAIIAVGHELSAERAVQFRKRATFCLNFLEPALSNNYRSNKLREARESPMHPLNRITQQPEVMGGKACIRGMRVTVGMVVGQIGAGHSIDEVLADYPYLEREDILQALRYAAWRAEEREVVLATA